MDSVHREEKTTVTSAGLFSGPKVEKEVVEVRQSGLESVKQGMHNLAEGVKSAVHSVSAPSAAPATQKTTVVKKEVVSSSSTL
jgi:hypothetical protein